MGNCLLVVREITYKSILGCSWESLRAFRISAMNTTISAYSHPMISLARKVPNPSRPSSRNSNRHVPTYFR